jgi:hypothetical protein
MSAHRRVQSASTIVSPSCSRPRDRRRPGPGSARRCCVTPVAATPPLCCALPMHPPATCRAPTALAPPCSRAPASLTPRTLQCCRRTPSCALPRTATLYPTFAPARSHCSPSHPLVLPPSALPPHCCPVSACSCGPPAASASSASTRHCGVVGVLHPLHLISSRRSPTASRGSIRSPSADLHFAIGPPRTLHASPTFSRVLLPRCGGHRSQCCPVT